MLNYLPDLNYIFTVLLQLFIVIILGFVHRWLQAHTTAKQRDILHQVAGEAYAYAKAVYVEHDGAGKLAAAMAYLSSRLKARGITFTPDEMRAAIEKARLAYKAATTQPGEPEPIEKIVEKIVQAPLPAGVQQIIDAARTLSVSATETPTVDQQAAAPAQSA
jgi:hypothetical protein